MDTFSGANVLWVLSGSLLLGLASGVLGSFALLRRRSLLGDALAHAALPGIGIAFILTGAKDLPILLTGALVAGIIGAWAVQFITRHSRIKEDAALGVVLSVFFAIGIVLLTRIQHSGAGNQSGLDKFLFGQAASMVLADVQVMAVSAAIVCLAAILLFKEFKLLCFDSQFARGIGFSPKFLDGLLMLLLVLVVVIGMQAVGVVLMSAMLVIPAAAARLWTERLTVMVTMAGIIGALSGALGTLFSTLGLRMPTGPLIVVSASVMFAISLVFAPRRGILARLLRLIGVRRTVARENVLRTIYEWAEKQGAWDTRFTIVEIASARPAAHGTLARQFAGFEREGLLQRADSAWRLSESGLRTAYHIVRNHRLWEMYLMHESQLSADHVDRDADEIEHHLSPAVVAQLEELLRLHSRELKLPLSVHPTLG